MTTIKLLALDDILEINQLICAQVKQKSICMDQAKIESALGAAFYPGNYPFYYGGIPKVAGALCFFIIKAHAFMDANKRTGVLASTLFLDLNGYELIYPLKVKSGRTAFTEITEQAAASDINKEQLIHWFDVHKKRKIENQQAYVELKISNETTFKAMQDADKRKTYKAKNIDELFKN